MRKGRDEKRRVAGGGKEGREAGQVRRGGGRWQAQVGRTLYHIGG